MYVKVMTFSELQSIGEETIVAYFKVLFQ